MAKRVFMIPDFIFLVNGIIVYDFILSIVIGIPILSYTIKKSDRSRSWGNGQKPPKTAKKSGIISSGRYAEIAHQYAP